MTDYWATLDEARGLWPDAPIDDALLTAMLSSAHEVCAEYAPTLSPVPYRYTQAVVLQAIESYQAMQRNGDVLGFGDSGYAIRVRPLSASVKSLLRPRRGVPALGKLGQTV